MTLWLTGLPAAGKTTLAQSLVGLLQQRDRKAILLDGDWLRAAGSRDLGYSAADRAEQARRATALAIERALEGWVAVVALVSPYRRDRERAREAHRAHAVLFAEVFVATPLEECERRDPKGLYRRARRGEIDNFTGVNDPYEPPQEPEASVICAHASPEKLATVVLSRVERRLRAAQAQV
jgi:bifunctional enzyme CysN/CysC